LKNGPCPIAGNKDVHGKSVPQSAGINKTPKVQLS